MQSLLPGSQLSEVAELKLAAGKLGEKGPGVRPPPPPKSPRNQGSGSGHWIPTGGQWVDTREGLRVAPHSTQQRNPSNWRLGAGGLLPPGWQRLTWHLVPGGRQVLLSPVKAPGKKSVRGDQHHSASGQVSLAGGHGSQGGPGGVGPGGRPSTSGPASLRRPLPGAAASSGRCQAAPSEVAARRAGGRASLPGSCLLLPPPSGSDIIPLSPRRSRSADSGKREKDGEPGAAWRGVRGRGSGTAGGRGFQSPVGDEGLTATGFGWKGRTGRVGGARTLSAAAGWGGPSCQRLGWQPPAPPRRQVAPGG